MDQVFTQEAQTDKFTKENFKDMNFVFEFETKGYLCQCWNIWQSDGKQCSANNILVC